MEKRKIELNKYAEMHEEKTFTGKDGTEVTVRDHIAYGDKEAMARELTVQSSVIHDDSCVYVDAEHDKYAIYLIAKYYTDIDTLEANPSDIADFIINNGLYKNIREYVSDD